MESATTMGKCKFNKCLLEQPEFSGLKVPNNEFEAQFEEDPQSGQTWCESTGVTYKIGKHWLASKSLYRSHTKTHFLYTFSPVMVSIFKPSAEL